MFVLDTSVTMSWCFEDESDSYGDRILDRLEETEAFVPLLWQLEVINVLVTAEQQDRIEPAGSREFINLLSALPISVDTPQTTTYIPEISSIARRLSLTAYDAAYIELSERQNIPLATLDENLREAVQKEGIETA